MYVSFYLRGSDAYFWGGPQTSKKSKVIPNPSPDRLYICTHLNKNDWQVSQILLQVTVDS